MSKEDQKPMTREDASRIQSATDRTGKNQDFKRRAESAADKNEAKTGAQSDKSGKR